MPFVSQIDLLPISLLVLLLYNARKNMKKSTEKSIFTLLIVFVLLVIVLDCISWMMHGDSSSESYLIIRTMNYLYFIISSLVGYTWFLYIFVLMYGENHILTHKLRFAAVSLPVFAFIICIFIKPELFFVLGTDNMYHRGPLIGIHLLLMALYIFLAGAHALGRALWEKVPAAKREKYRLAGFMIFPFVGGIIQVINGHLFFLWPSMTAAVFLIYLNDRQSNIQKDSLTGTWNRRWLDEYLNKKFQESGLRDEWSLYLIDLDGFKKINDEYGHVEGNHALQKAAAILQRVFTKERAFVARYGGDEFVIVMDCSEKIAKKMLKDLDVVLNEENKKGDVPYEIFLSIGGATFDRDQYGTLEELIAQADYNMYQQKEEKRA